MAYDPYSDRIALLLDFEGANGSTTITDYSLVPKTITPNGNAQISTANFKFGSSCLLLDGTGDYLSIPYSSGGLWLPWDFTIECWIYMTAGTNTYRYIYNDDESNPYGITLAVKNTNVLRATFSTTGSIGGFFELNGVSTVTLNSWHHIAINRLNTDIRIFLDGSSEANTTVSDQLYNNNNTKVIGYQKPFASNYFTGYIDEFRISKNFARYGTSNFTPPTAPFDGVDPQLFESIIQRKSIHFSTNYLNSIHNNLISINR